MQKINAAVLHQVLKPLLPFVVGKDGEHVSQDACIFRSRIIHATPAHVFMSRRIEELPGDTLVPLKALSGVLSILGDVDVTLTLKDTLVIKAAGTTQSLPVMSLESFFVNPEVVVSARPDVVTSEEIDIRFILDALDLAASIANKDSPPASDVNSRPEARGAFFLNRNGKCRVHMTDTLTYISSGEFNANVVTEALDRRAVPGAMLLALKKFLNSYTGVVHEVGLHHSDAGSPWLYLGLDDEAYLMIQITEPVAEEAFFDYFNEEKLVEFNDNAQEVPVDLRAKLPLFSIGSKDDPTKNLPKIRVQDTALQLSTDSTQLMFTFAKPLSRTGFNSVRLQVDSADAGLKSGHFDHIHICPEYLVLMTPHSEGPLAVIPHVKQ